MKIVRKEAAHHLTYKCGTFNENAQRWCNNTLEWCLQLVRRWSTGQRQHVLFMIKEEIKFLSTKIKMLTNVSLKGFWAELSCLQSSDVIIHPSIYHCFPFAEDLGDCCSHHPNFNNNKYVWNDQGGLDEFANNVGDWKLSYYRWAWQTPDWVGSHDTFTKSVGGENWKYVNSCSPSPLLCSVH